MKKKSSVRINNKKQHKDLTICVTGHYLLLVTLIISFLIYEYVCVRNNVYEELMFPYIMGTEHMLLVLVITDVAVAIFIIISGMEK